MVRPSVPVLLAWRPEELESAGSELVSRSAGLQWAGGDLAGVGRDLASVWSGAAADAASGHTATRTGELDAVAEVVHTAGQALITAGAALAAAQASLRSAVGAAAAAGCTVLDGGLVVGPPAPVEPPGLDGPALAGWQTQADGAAEAVAATAGALTSQIGAALDAAAAADTTAQGALTGLTVPTISPPPQVDTAELAGSGGDWRAGADGQAAPAPAPKPEKHHWYDDLTHLADDARHATGEFAGGAWDAAKDVGGTLLNVGDYAVSHPGDMLKLAGDTAEIGLSALALAAGAAGEIGGTALDATGVGAPVGVPINAASATLIGGGLALGAHGARRWGSDATTMWNEAQDAGSGGSSARLRSLDHPESLVGASPDDIRALIPDDWPTSASRGEGGLRYTHPTHRGEQIRVMPGKLSDPNPVKPGPYLRISRNGKISSPVPLSGNPTLP